MRETDRQRQRDSDRETHSNSKTLILKDKRQTDRQTDRQTQTETKFELGEREGGIKILAGGKDKNGLLTPMSECNL